MTAAKKKDLLKVAAREKAFSTLAKKEGAGAKARLRRETTKHEPARAKDTKWEVSVDEKFAKERMKRSNSARSKAEKE
jgi:hypothetical protein